MFQSTTVTIYSTLFRWLLVGSSLEEWIVVLQRGQWLFGVLGMFSELHHHQKLTLCSSCSRQWLSSQFNTCKGHYWYVIQTQSTSHDPFLTLWLFNVFRVCIDKSLLLEAQPVMCNGGWKSQDNRDHVDAIKQVSYDLHQDEVFLKQKIKGCCILLIRWFITTSLCITRVTWGQWK